jgi:hypothetical protein
VLDYLRRDMTHPDGGLFSAEDADSADPQQGGKKSEGAFYVWRRQEVEQLLGSSARVQPFCAHYGVKAEGNCSRSGASDPHGEFGGLNVLYEVGGHAGWCGGVCVDCGVCPMQGGWRCVWGGGVGGAVWWRGWRGRLEAVCAVAAGMSASAGQHAASCISSIC